jgi:hypothetical protein
MKLVRVLSVCFLLCSFTLCHAGCGKNEPSQAPETQKTDAGQKAAEAPRPVDLGENKILIDDLEGDIACDNGAGNGAEIQVTFSKKDAAPDEVYSGNQAMKISYDKTYGGYMFCARGFGLTPAVEMPQEKLQWSTSPDKIDFSKYNSFGFYFKGENTGNTIAVDVFDKDREIFRYEFNDDSSDWKEMTIPFSSFKLRTDYQPDWNKSNKAIDFPIVTYQFEPMTGTGKLIKGYIIIDAVYFAVTDQPQAVAPAQENTASPSAEQPAKPEEPAKAEGTQPAVSATAPAAPSSQPEITPAAAPEAPAAPENAPAPEAPATQPEVSPEPAAAPQNNQ